MLLSVCLCLALPGIRPPVALPGSNLSLEHAASKSRFILVAQVVSFGDYSMASRGTEAYPEATLEPLQALKGGSEGMKIQKVVMHRRQGRWNIRGEVMPARGKDYIFFIETLNQGQRVIKVLLKTDENIRRLSVP